MKIAAVIEDRGGMMFNHRRLSRDRALNQRIEYLADQLTGGGRLWVAPYSAELFQEAVTANNSSGVVVDSDFPKVVVDEDFLEKAGENDFCFVEDRPLKPYASRISELYLFHWNRRYPADLYFDLPLDGYRLVSQEEFAGYSHEKISEEHYKK
ncbi:MAG: ribonuclease Z [Eubacteriales bacterium]|jgi:hypothetical protein